MKNFQCNFIFYTFYLKKHFHTNTREKNLFLIPDRSLLVPDVGRLKCRNIPMIDRRQASKIENSRRLETSNSCEQLTINSLCLFTWEHGHKMADK